MRLYLKLIAAIFVFVVAAQLPAWEWIDERLYEARAAAVCRIGDAAAFEALLDETQRRHAAKVGDPASHLRKQRVEELVETRTVVATILHGPQSEADLGRIKEACVREAYGLPPATDDPETPALAAMLAPPR